MTLYCLLGFGLPSNDHNLLSLQSRIRPFTWKPWSLSHSPVCSRVTGLRAVFAIKSPTDRSALQTSYKRGPAEVCNRTCEMNFRAALASSSCAKSLCRIPCKTSGRNWASSAGFADIGFAMEEAGEDCNVMRGFRRGVESTDDVEDIDEALVDGDDPTECDVEPDLPEVEEPVEVEELTEPNFFGC